MNIYQVLSLIGFPSLFAAAILWFVRKSKRSIKKYKSDETLLKEGMQALLRAQMISDYNHWEDKGYAPIYARENFENCWKNYHGLGANGVMDNIHKNFMALPTDKPLNK